MKKSLLIVGSFLLIQAVLGLLLELLATNFPHIIKVGASTYLATLLLSSILVFFATIKICKKSPIEPFLWKLHTKGGGFIVLLSLITTLPIIVFSNSLIEILNLPDLLADSFSDMADAPLALWVMALSAPLAEEICFRYGIINSLLEERRLSNVSIIIVSAMIFGIIHFNPSQMVGATIVGLYLGWLFVVTKSLWPALLCHILNNAIAVTMLRNFPSDFMIADLLPNHNMIYLVAAVSLIAVGLSLYLLNKTVKSFCK